MVAFNNNPTIARDRDKKRFSEGVSEGNKHNFIKYNSIISLSPYLSILADLIKR